jgi:hypothetical protein
MRVLLSATSWPTNFVSMVAPFLSLPLPGSGGFPLRISVACKRLILIEAPSSADQRGMLRVAKTLVTNTEETSMRFYTKQHPFYPYNDACP